MTKVLEGKRILLGVTGSIAAYKAADITSQLVKLSAQVDVVMTKSATQFITPLTLQTLSRRPVSSDIWEEGNGWQPGHIELADAADLIVIAPATANFIAQAAHGQAPDLLSSIYLATPAPVMIAPAMNGKMWAHSATQTNVETLKLRKHTFIDPAEGMLACGYEGPGKLAAVEDIIGEIVAHFEAKLNGSKLV